eukprot:7561852-Pyramimonas_sp.AAC.1
MPSGSRNRSSGNQRSRERGTTPTVGSRKIVFSNGREVAGVELLQRNQESHLIWPMLSHPRATPTSSGRTCTASCHGVSPRRGALASGKSLAAWRSGR